MAPSTRRRSLKTCHADGIMFARIQQPVKPAARASRAVTCLALAVLTACAMPARASFLSGEALDTAADILAVVILFVVPIVAITAFWLVHVLPEKIAEK